MNKLQSLRDEIGELKRLIAGAPGDPESQWACYLLRTCLENRERRLAELIRDAVA